MPSRPARSSPSTTVTTTSVFIAGTRGSQWFVGLSWGSMSAASRRPVRSGPVMADSSVRPPRTYSDRPVIRLDAATVLLQWSVGGLLFLWFTTRRREKVGLGYGWLLRGTNLVLAVGALACGLAFGVVPVREVSSAAVAIASLVVLVVSIVQRLACGVSGADVEHDRRSAVGGRDDRHRS